MAISEVAGRPRSVARSAASEPGFPWYVVLLICATPFLFRFHLLSVPFAFNPDEAQWAVTARRALEDPMLFRSLDMTTSGPLNALPITWPTLFGVTPSIVTSRLTAFALQSLTLFGMTTFIRRGEALSLGTAAILAAAMWITLQPHHMLLGYESETLPNLLMVLFCMVFAGLRADVAPGPRLAVCGLIAGALPFAKMQSAPFAVIFEAACCFRLWMDMRVGRARPSDGLWWFLGSVAPLLLLVGPLFFVGEQSAFFIGYLGLALGYGGGDHTQILRNAMVFVVVMAVVYVAVVAAVREPGTRRESRLDLLLLSAGMWPAGLYAIWRPGQDFMHYLLFIVIGLPLAVLLAQYALPVAKPRLPVLARLAAMLLVVGLQSMSFLRHESSGPSAIVDLFRMSAAERAFTSPGAGARPLYAWTGANGNDSMLVWGSEPELTAFSGLRSAERTAETEYDIRPNPGREYFRGRLLRDLSRTNPAIVLDAGRPPYFFTTAYSNFDPEKERWDLSTFPALEQLVEANYELVAGGGDCASVYLRKDMAEALKAAEVPLQSPVAALVDGPTTERCKDWWAPDSSGATAEFSVASPAPVKELWILSSRGGPNRDRGATKARITVVGASGQRAEQVAVLYAYPNWTVVAPPDVGPVTRIEIEPLDYVGKGPALAGVRAFDRRW